MKISQYPQDSAPLTTDIMVMVDQTNSATKKVAISDLIALFTTSLLPSGVMTEFAGKTAPSGWLLCYGQAISRTTYAGLFAALVPTVGTPTVTIASPGVFTLTGHGLQIGDAVYLTTTGALPTGLSANTLYYVAATSFAANTFTLTASRGGSAINTSGTQSGTHTLHASPHGIGDGSTTFNLPDMRGRSPSGADAMGGTAASRVTSGGSGIYGAAVGATGGEETHTLTSTEMPSHSHTQQVTHGTSGGYGFVDSTAASSSGTATSPTNTATAGSGGAHNNMEPTTILNYIIKT
ncbi:MAG TPA: tail fiber protein [Nitrospira sp.]|nr:tail fiber protein [Nitrospira sp.]